MFWFCWCQSAAGDRLAGGEKSIPVKGRRFGMALPGMRRAIARPSLGCYNSLIRQGEKSLLVRLHAPTSATSCFVARTVARRRPRSGTSRRAPCRRRRPAGCDRTVSDAFSRRCRRRTDSAGRASIRRDLAACQLTPLLPRLRTPRVCHVLRDKPFPTSDAVLLVSGGSDRSNLSRNT